MVYTASHPILKTACFHVGPNFPVAAMFSRTSPNAMRALPTWLLTRG